MKGDEAALLRVSGLQAGYGAAPVIDDLDLELRRGEICVVVGANGAGKSTLLATISGLLQPTAGSIRFDGQEIAGASCERIVRAGLVHVPEGRRLFRGLTVAENLDLGFWGLKLGRAEEKRRLERVVELFPILGERMARQAEVMSGGEQQMLVIAQALLSEPALLLLDEPSLGLAPSIVDRVLEVLKTLRETGLAILLVEQAVERALAIADQGYVVQRGRVVATGSGPELLAGPELRAAYLGSGATLASTGATEGESDGLVER